MRIAVGSDHRGVELRAKLIEFLQQLGQEVVDIGTHEQQDVDYPDIAAAVARKVGGGEVDRGILVCGTGVGMCIVANKIPGVRRAVPRRHYGGDEPPAQRPERFVPLRRFDRRAAGRPAGRDLAEDAV